MKNTKIALLRGYPLMVDGEATAVEEMYKWGKTNLIDFKSYHLHPVWKKKVPDYDHLPYEHPTQIFNRNMVEEIKEELEEYDLVILINPARMISGLKQPDVRSFHDLYRSLEKPKKVMMMHNNVKKTMYSIPFLYSYFEASDRVFGHYRDVKENFGVNVKIEPFNLWRDILSHGDIRNSQPRENKISYVGRYSPYKGAVTLLKIAPALDHNGIEAELNGMDGSIGCKTAVLNHPNCHNVLQKQEKNEGEIVSAYGLMDPDKVIPHFSGVMFSSNLITFKDSESYKQFGGRLEYVMQESIIAGSIMVVTKQWSENCTTYNGVPYKEIPNLAVVIDIERPYEGIQEMKRLINDPEEAQLYRDTAYKFLIDNYEITKILPDIIDEMLNTRRKPVYPTVEQIIRSITFPELADKLIEKYNNGDAIPLAPNSIGKDFVCEFGGKSGKALVRL